MGMVMVSSMMSAAYRKRKPELSKDFINLVMGKTGTWIAFGLLPGLALAVLYRMLLFNSAIPIHQYLFRLLGLQIAAVLLLMLYRKTTNLLIGAAGALLTLLYCFHLVNVMSFLVYPEKWPFEKMILPYPLFSITPLVQFGAFLFMSLILTGAAILFIYYKWSERKLKEESPHYNLLKYHGYGFLMGGASILPLMIFWDLATLPVYSLSIGVFVLSALVIFTLFLLLSASVSMVRHYKEAKPRYIVASFVLALVLFGLVIGKDRTLQANANLETVGVLKMDAQKTWDEEVGVREEIYAKTAGISAQKGEEIFNQKCTSCHAFDTKKLGPPLNSVLPKYVGKEEQLIEYIKNPVKIDPAYPAMPNPGLTGIRIKSVVKFLMGKVSPKEGNE
jgi:cytochrome c